MITLIISIFIVLLTLKTIGIGINLALISEQNANSQTWRINESGIAAANAVYDKNSEFRNSIYNSTDGYTKWISTSGDLVQLVVGLSLIVLSVFSCYIWYTYISMKIRRIRRRLSNKRKNHLRNNGQIA
ncbi:MAG: hypothetical protein PHD15_05625 [Clostridia bacterium]|nr:hypothetical protein [Clostridia bacterium]